MSKRWIGVDFDHTLCREDGSPVEAMVERVKRWIAEGKIVKIVTARVNHDFTNQRHRKECFSFSTGCDLRCPLSKYGIDRQEAEAIVQRWCERHIGVRLEVTGEKSPGMIELWDDRAVRVEKNTGWRLSPSELEDGHSAEYRRGWSDREILEGKAVVERDEILSEFVRATLTSDPVLANRALQKYKELNK